MAIQKKVSREKLRTFKAAPRCGLVEPVKRNRWFARAIARHGAGYRGKVYLTYIELRTVERRRDRRRGARGNYQDGRVRLDWPRHEILRGRLHGVRLITPSAVSPGTLHAHRHRRKPLTNTQLGYTVGCRAHQSARNLRPDGSESSSKS